MSNHDPLSQREPLEQPLSELDGLAADSTVGQLQAELETIARELRQSLPADPYQHEAACARAVELACGIGLEVAPQSIAAETAELGDIGPYRLLKRLGQGGMGTVYKALHLRLDKVVALKVLQPGRLRDDELLGRFQREMKAVGKLDHPNLIRALDAGKADGTHYLVMEHLAGTDLAALLKRNGPLPIAEACELVAQAAKGLQAAHTRGLVHRDIKPANLMLARQDFGPPLVKVLDLGLALLSGTHGGEESGLTSDRQIMGTIEYMAPEQADNSHAVDIRADIYSLGATLYALLTGGSLFQGGPRQTLLQKLSALATEPIPPLRTRRADVSEALAGILHRMLARDPSQRFATPAEVAAALAPFATGADLSALLSPAADTTRDDDSGVGKETSATLAMIAPLPEPAAVRTGTVVRKSPPPRRRSVAIAAAALAGAVFLGAILLLLRTPHGEVIVELPDDVPDEMAKQLQIQVRGNGEVRVADASTGWTIDVQEGRYEVHLNGGGDSLRIEDQQLTVTRGKQAIVRVTLKPADAAPGPVVAAPDLEGPSGEAPSPAIAPFDAGQAQALQAAWAKHLGLPVEYTNSLGMKFILIPPGEFLMGSTPEEAAAALEASVPDNDDRWPTMINSETPRHKVILTKPMYLGVYEVTQRQYQAVMGQNPSEFVAGAGNVAGLDTSNFPVERVSWFDAAEFCAKLGQREQLEPYYLRSGDEAVSTLGGLGYRLPSEAEWEFACRAGTTTRFWSGDSDDDLPRAGWLKLNSGGRTHAVGELKANPFGLYDMLGNVGEFMQDGGDPNAKTTYFSQFQDQPAVDPKGPPSPDYRMVKGGHFFLYPFACRAASRWIGALGPVGGNMTGFRAAISVDGDRQQTPAGSPGR